LYSRSGVFGGLRLSPSSADSNFYDGIFAVLSFFLPEHQNLGIH